jgi:hypothetical protein
VRGGVTRARLQRRTLRVLVGAQVLSGLGVSAAAAGALLALDITGSEALASLPLALLVVGSSATVMPISALSRRSGRRTGLTVALAVAAAAGHDALPLAIGLGLLGVGWNVGLIAGSTLLASAVPVAQRPRMEGVGELSMGVAAATATAISGPVVGLAGYAVLAVAGAAAAAALAPFLVAVARRGVPAVPAPANRLLG